MPLLKIEDLKVYYPVNNSSLFKRKSYFKAVDGISFSIEKGKAFALVGESGSGKTSTGRAIVGLTKAYSGKIIFNDRDLVAVSPRRRRPVNQKIQMIFQDPYSSLNPRKRIISIITEPLRALKKLNEKERWEYAEKAVRDLGLTPDILYKYPYEFSGGQRQRIGIARSLIVKPEIIVADEPVSALDLSVQAQVINSMKKIQSASNLSYLFISHDLGVVRYFCDEIGIMYRGRLVERGTTRDIFKEPLHIYTRRLLASNPKMTPSDRELFETQRLEIEQQFQDTIDSLLDEDGKPFPLIKINEHHYVSAPPEQR